MSTTTAEAEPEAALPQSALPGRPARAAAAVRRSLRDDPMAWGALALFAIAGLVWLLHPYQPVEDLAITELEVRRVGPHFPLTGAYSYLPFRHPGPALFLALAPAYRLFGEHSSALLAANLWIVGLFAAATLAVARRLAGHGFALLVAAGIALWSLANGLPLLLQPWNPYVGAIPAILLILLGWALVEGSTKAVPAIVVTGSWMIQVHIQFAPIVVAVVGACGTVLLVRTLRSGDPARRRRLLRSSGAAVAIGLVLWAPPLIDFALHGGASGPARIVSYLRHGTDQPTISTRDITGIARSELSVRPTWAGGPTPYDQYLNGGTRSSPWLLLALVGTAALALWRRLWRDLRGIAVASFALASALVGVSRITGAIGSWYLIAAEAASITLVASLVHTALAAARSIVAARRSATGTTDHRTSATSWGWGRGACAVVAVGLLAVAVVDLRQPYSEANTAAAARQVLPAVEERLGDGPVLIEGRWSLNGWVYSVLALELEKRGHDVSVRTIRTGKFPSDMEDDPPAGAKRFVVFADPDPALEWSPGVEMIAELDYSLDPDKPLTHLVVVEAPMDSPVQVEP